MEFSSYMKATQTTVDTLEDKEKYEIENKMSVICTTS